MAVMHQKGLFSTHCGKSRIYYKYNIPINIFKTAPLEFPPHWHESMEIIYVTGEKLQLGYNNSVYTLNPRDIFVVWPGEIHYFLMQQDRCERLIIQLEFSIFGELSTLVSSQKVTNGYIPVTHDMHAFFENLILKLSNESLQRQKGYEFLVGAGLYELTGGLLRHLPTETVCALEQNKHLKRLEILESVFKYIDKNYQEQITLDEVAKVANFSMYHFTRFFKEATGLTFWQYLNNYKISKAVNLLLASTDSIAEIAFKCGFNSIKTFNRVFKQAKGVSPSQFKRATFE